VCIFVSQLIVVSQTVVTGNLFHRFKNNQREMKNLKLLSLGLSAFLIINSGCNNSSDKSQTESSNTATNNNKIMEENHFNSFGKNYAEAWCSQKPGSVAAFFANNGSLTVNNDSPAIGRVAIAKVAEGFMTAFPDMMVTMDSLTTTSDGLEFHWTLTGTNSGPNGTGKKVRISGFELWKIDNDGLIYESKGSFDADEYNRQLK
jgi:predicted ester cyclase